MLGEKMEEALNGQLNAELYSAYLYLSMSAYYHSINLPGFANWMRVQWAEELKHTLKFFDYIAESGRVLLRPVEVPPREWDSALAPFEAAYAHEQKVTGLINSLVELATSQGDEVTSDFLQWYVDEQVEEEESSSGAVEKIKAAADSADELDRLDQEFAQRK
jgi:ferritin